MSTVLGAINYASVTSGAVDAFESGVTQALPILGLILGATLAVKGIKRFAS
jgi:hypothetical protein